MFFFVFVLALLSGCSSALEMRRAELAQLAEWLPGYYDNVEQAAADRARSGLQHEALALAIVPVYAPALGERVFYAQEMAAGDARRVLAQRLLAFDATKAGIVQRTFMLDDPVRWRDGHRNPDLFKGLMPGDVRPSPGCDLLWRKEGERFAGHNDPALCRSTSRAAGGSVSVESKRELAAAELAISDRAFGPDARLAQGQPAEPFYRFRKRPPPD